MMFRGVFLNCCIADLCKKEVINLKDGTRLGNVCDVEIDTCKGCLVSIVIYGKNKLFGLSGRCDDIKIEWCNIKVIGDDTVLVDIDCPEWCRKQYNDSVFDSLFKHKS